MMRSVVNSLLLTVLSFSALLMHGCGGSEVIATTGGSEVIGTLVREDNSPVANIRVEAAIINEYKVSEHIEYDTVPVRNTWTDSKGSFKLDSLPDTLCTLIAYPDDSLVLPATTFTPDPDSQIDLAVIVMKRPGKITGTIQTDNLPQEATVVCYIPGTSYAAYVYVKNGGQFTISNIPPDISYSVTVQTDEFFPRQLEPILVQSGTTVSYSSPISLERKTTGTIPIPDSITVWYDTLSGTLSATWAAVQVLDVNKYVVYTSLKTDQNTSDHVDTVFEPSFSKTIFNSSDDTIARTVYLQIAALDDAGNTSQYTEIDSLTAPPPSILGISIALHAGEDTPSPDTIPVIAEFSGKVRSVVKIDWWADDSSTIVVTRELSDLKNGTDTLLWNLGSEHKTIGITLHDNAGGAWTKSIDATTFHPKNVWKSIGSLNAERRYAGACVVDNTIIVFGGACEKSDMFGVGTAGIKSAERYDAANNTWIIIDSMEYPRYNAAYTEFDGKIYVFGGISKDSDQELVERTVEMYDPAKNSWTIIDTMDTPIVGAAACRLGDEIIISGGKTRKSGSFPILNTVSIFTPADSSWKSVDKKMFTPRMEHKALTFSDGNSTGILLLGGYSYADNGLLDVVDVTASECLTSIASLTIPSITLENGCFSFGAGIVEDKLVVFGGLKKSNVNDTLRTVDVFSLTGGEHRTGIPMPVKSEGMAVVSFNNCIYSIGGSVEGTSLQKSGKAVYVYYP